MTKDVNQMNSIEYAEYKMQQNRTWKNQQYDRFRKDQEKQKNEQLVKDLLGLTFGEMKANAEYNLQTMQLNNLNDSIKTVANLASANEIQKEREALLNKYGTAENIWSYQAASRAFNNPEIASLKITSLSDLDKALATGLINPQQHNTYKNSFEVEKNRYKDLWENDKSFDKYNDNFVTTRTAELKALRDTKLTTGAIGLITGKDQDARDLIQNNYNLIFEENSAVSKSLSTRQSILAGNTKTNVSQKEIDNVVAQNILQDDNVTFKTLKAQIAPLISKTARIYADSDKIEARFDKLIKEKYENNETFNIADVWNEAIRPFNRNFRYDEIAAVTKYIDTAKQNGADNAVIQAKVKDNFGLDVDLVSKAPISYGQLALQGEGTISDVLAAQLMTTTEGKNFIKNNPNVLQNTAKGYMLLTEDEKEAYVVQAENRLKSIKPYLTDDAWLSNTFGDRAESLDVTTKARKKVLDELFQVTKGTSPAYVHQSILDEFNNIVGMTIYDVDKAGLTGDDRNKEINGRLLNLVDNLEMVDDELVLKPNSDVAFKQLNFNKSLQDNQQYNPKQLQLEKALNTFNLSQETFMNNTDDEEAKNVMLTNAAIIIDEVVKQNPNINTIQKLRESSFAMGEMLNSIEVATPTTSIQELLDYLPKVSNDEMAQNIPAPSSTQELIGPPRPTGTQTPAPTPAPDLTKEEPEVVAEALPLVASDDVYNSFTKDQKNRHDSLNESLQEINADLEDPTNLTTRDIQRLTKRKTDIERSLRNLIRGSAFYRSQEKDIQKELDAIERQLNFRRDVLTQQDIQDLRAKQVELREQLKLEQTKPSDYVDPKLLQPSLLSRPQNTGVGVTNKLTMAESSDNPDALWKQSQRNQFKDFKATESTMDEVLDFVRLDGPYAKWSKGQSTKNEIHTPVGKYQFVGTTLRDIKDRGGFEDVGITGDTLFTPEVQDKLFVWYMNDTIRAAGKDASPAKVRGMVRKRWEGATPRNISDRELDELINAVQSGTYI